MTVFITKSLRKKVVPEVLSTAGTGVDKEAYGVHRLRGPPGNYELRITDSVIETCFRMISITTIPVSHKPLKTQYHDKSQCE
jgi:hypothetical protein